MARNNFNERLIKAFGEEVGKINDVISENRPYLARAIIDEIKASAAGGISPIAGKGRFPAYKAVAEEKRIKGAAKFAKKFGARGNAFSKEIAAQAKAIRRAGYPESVRRKFPGKRARPVNLFLSGRFLSLLTFKLLGGTKGTQFEIGFYDSKAQAMEQGHREGANTQGIRPIIPIAGEDFSARIMRRALDLVELAIARRTRAG